MAMKIQYPTAKSSVITPTMIPATARPRPRSPVAATLRRAAAPSQIPATDPSPPSVRIDRTSDQMAILLMRSAVGVPYSGARVAVSGLDMVVLLLLDDIPRGSLRPAGKRSHVPSGDRRAVHPVIRKRAAGGSRLPEAAARTPGEAVACQNLRCLSPAFTRRAPSAPAAPVTTPFVKIPPCSAPNSLAALNTGAAAALNPSLKAPLSVAAS